MQRASADERSSGEGARWGARAALAGSLALLAAFVAFTALHLGDARHFASLAERAEPTWMLAAVALQLATYVCAGAIWGRVTAAAGHPLPPSKLARLAVEKLTVDQLVPTAGLGGNVVVAAAMRAMGVPAGVATEAVLVDVLSWYGGMLGTASAALLVLGVHHDVTPPLLVLFGLFASLVAIVPIAIAWATAAHRRPFRGRLARLLRVNEALRALDGVSAARVWSPRVLPLTIALQTTIVVLDAATLWTVLRALGHPADPWTAFVALVVATVAGTLSFLPGGIASFEAATTATLALLGVPLEAALTGTLLLRGLTLWLPLAPGALLARRDLASLRSARQDEERSRARPSPLLALDALLPALGSATVGLTTDEARRRLALEGPNSVESTPQRTLLRELARALATPLALLLAVAAIVAAFLGQTTDALIIGAMVVLSAGIDVWQSARSARALRGLEARVAPTASVLRDGTAVVVPRADLVPGDVVQLSAGDLVPADARLLATTELHVDQAALTGESLPVEKAASSAALAGGGPDARELVFVGTSIVSGSGSAVIVATGRSTAFGELAARLAARPEETELERGTRRFGVLVVQTVTFLVVFIVIVSVALGRDAFTSVLFAVALAVGLTPEYLPVITSVTLAHGAIRMAHEKVIVRHLASIANLGSIDILCSDKTGTLTSGTMSLDASLDAWGSPSSRPLALARLNSAFETGVRSPLDAAILRAAASPAPVPEHRKLGEVPFDFERRRLSVILEAHGAASVITKGAPESVLACCSHVEVGGARVPLDEDARRRSLDVFRALSDQGYRVLAVACRELSAPERGPAVERDLVLTGYVTFADELLPGVAEAIAKLRDDGVAIKIVSGDNELVTHTLCRKVGIDAERVVTGEQVARADDRALGVLAERATVFARISPAQKHRIVTALKHRGHVVAFLGDGINDAPSLHAADVGISVAGAVDVAREASDLMLLERRLDVLHAGILAGRRSLANVMKYLLMGTSSNFGNVLSMALAVLFLPFLPMLPTQILVNNFLYDLSQVAIPTDRVDPASLRGPQRWDVRVVRRFMLVIGPISSLFDVATFATLLFVFGFGESLFQTGWFVESLLTQVLVLFVIRTARRPWKDRPSPALAVACALVLAVGCALPYTPLAAPLGMRPLPPSFFAFLAIVVPLYLAMVEWVKRRLLQRLARPATLRSEPREWRGGDAAASSAP